MMFDLESKINVLAEDYGLEALIEMLDITPYAVVNSLIQTGLLDTDEIIRLTEELEWWEGLEE